jgi:hypothetical protein
MSRSLIVGAWALPISEGIVPKNFASKSNDLQVAQRTMLDELLDAFSTVIGEGIVLQSTEQVTRYWFPLRRATS